MALNEDNTKLIIDLVKKEPRTIQDISKVIKKSWLTADSYVKQVKERTGLIDIKTFRAGTQGALKLVYYNHKDALLTNDLKEELYHKIKNGRYKPDFDFMELFQFIPENKKKCYSEAYVEDVPYSKDIIDLHQGVQKQLYCFSGNLSFLNIKKNNISLFEVWEELLKRKVRINILCRINLASLSNFDKIIPLFMKYPELIEIHHCYQPLRGFVVDDKLSLFRYGERVESYRKGELAQNIRIIYEIYDQEWITWLQKVFWNLFRYSIDYQSRIKEIKSIG